MGLIFNLRKSSGGFKEGSEKSDLGLFCLLCWEWVSENQRTIRALTRMALMAFQVRDNDVLETNARVRDKQKYTCSGPILEVQWTKFMKD